MKEQATKKKNGLYLKEFLQFPIPFCNHLQELLPLFFQLIVITLQTYNAVNRSSGYRFDIIVPLCFVFHHTSFKRLPGTNIILFLISRYSQVKPPVFYLNKDGNPVVYTHFIYKVCLSLAITASMFFI